MHRIVRRLSLVFTAATLCATSAAPITVDGDGDRNSPSCNLRMTRGSYGFQCHGSSFTGTVHEPVTFVGTVDGDGAGTFDGFGTFNSSAGSASTHVRGSGTLSPRCFGHVDYTTNEILLPDGGTVQLPPVSFDFAVVDGGKEILGTGVAPAGVTGDFVPRLTCRLVRIP